MSLAARPAEEWVRQEHAPLRVIDTDLWQAAQQRLWVDLHADEIEDRIDPTPAEAARLLFQPFLRTLIAPVMRAEENEQHV